jgi:hypothetical protein
VPLGRTDRDDELGDLPVLGIWLAFGDRARRTGVVVAAQASGRVCGPGNACADADHRMGCWSGVVAATPQLAQELACAIR